MLAVSLLSGVCILPGSFNNILNSFPPDIPAQARFSSAPFPGTDLLFKNPPMQMPGIRSNIQSHFRSSVWTCCHENARTRALRYLCTGAVYPYLYMKQLYTPPCVSCCQPPKLKSEFSVDWWIYCFPVSLTGKRASIRCTSVRLSLTLFVLRILADYSDASFSFNNFAFFTNWFYWWSNLHVKSSFPSLLCLHLPVNWAHLPNSDHLTV